MPEVVGAKPREGKFNKNAARRVRVAGRIPAVLYGSGHEPVAIEVEPKQISRILFSEAGRNTIFDVEVAGQPSANWFQRHVTSWSGSLSIGGLVDDVRTYLGVLAFGLGLVFGFTFDTTGPRMPREPVSVAEPVAYAPPAEPVAEPEPLAEPDSQAERERVPSAQG